MALPNILDEEILFAATQSAVNVVPTIDEDSAVRAYDVAFDYEGKMSIKRKTMGGSSSMPKPLFGGSAAAITVNWEMASKGGTVSPEHAALYKACGFIEEKVAAGNNTPARVDYKLSTPQTQYIYMLCAQGKYTRPLINGRANSFTIEIEAGNTIRCSATFVGNLGDDLDEPINNNLPVPNYDQVVPVVAASDVNTITRNGGGTGVPVDSDKISMDFGVSTALLKSVSHKNAYAPPIRTMRDISIGLNPTFPGTINYIKEWSKNSTYAFDHSFDSLDGDDENRIRFFAGQCAYSDVADENRDSVRARKIVLVPSFNGRFDNDLVISFMAKP